MPAPSVLSRGAGLLADHSYYSIFLAAMHPDASAPILLGGRMPEVDAATGEILSTLEPQSLPDLHSLRRPPRFGLPPSAETYRRHTYPESRTTAASI